jgi:hypothetical protein
MSDSLKPKRRWRRTTEVQVEQIRMFSLVGMAQRQIVKEVGVNIGTVNEVQRRLGFNVKDTMPVPKEIEEQIVQLYKDGISGRRIAEQISLPFHRVEIVLQAHRLKPPAGAPGCVYAVPDAIKKAIRREFRQFEKHIAAKFNVSDVWTRRFLRRRTK